MQNHSDIDFRIKEAKEREAFPELYPEPRPVSATLQAIWNLDDSLRAIDAAERILRRGYMSAVDHDRVSAALDGRTPEQARAAARARFARVYSDAVASEAVAA